MVAGTCTLVCFMSICMAPVTPLHLRLHHRIHRVFVSARTAIRYDVMRVLRIVVHGAAKFESRWADGHTARRRCLHFHPLSGYSRDVISQRA